MSPIPRRLRTAVVTGAVVVGASVGAAGIATAATGSSSSTSSSGPSSTAPSSTAPSGRTPPGGGTTPPDPASMTHGPGETLLTGTDLQKATAAAEAAEPGATVVRAETDSSGDATYEVHMKEADGSYVTVELDSTFAVTKTVSGFGPGPAGGQPPSGGTPPNGTPPSGAA